VFGVGLEDLAEIRKSGVAYYATTIGENMARVPAPEMDAFVNDVMPAVDDKLLVASILKAGVERYVFTRVA